MAKESFLLGHSGAPSSILPLLKGRMNAHYNEHEVREFIAGQYVHFDDLAATTGKRIKQRHPDVRLMLMTPYFPYPSAFDLPKDYDETLYPKGMETVPKRVAIVRANAKMTEHADTVIRYVHRPGNARTLLNYADAASARGRSSSIRCLKTCPTYSIMSTPNPTRRRSCLWNISPTSITWRITSTRHMTRCCSSPMR